MSLSQTKPSVQQLIKIYNLIEHGVVAVPQTNLRYIGGNVCWLGRLMWHRRRTGDFCEFRSVCLLLCFYPTKACYRITAINRHDETSFYLRPKSCKSSTSLAVRAHQTINPVLRPYQVRACEIYMVKDAMVLMVCVIITSVFIGIIENCMKQFVHTQCRTTN